MCLSYHRQNRGLSPELRRTSGLCEPRLAGEHVCLPELQTKACGIMGDGRDCRPLPVYTRVDLLDKDVASPLKALEGAAVTYGTTPFRMGPVETVLSAAAHGTVLR